MLKLLVSYFIFMYLRNNKNDAHWGFCRLNKLRPLKMNDGPTPRRTKSSISFTLNQKKSQFHQYIEKQSFLQIILSIKCDQELSRVWFLKRNAAGETIMAGCEWLRFGFFQHKP